MPKTLTEKKFVGFLKGAEKHFQGPVPSFDLEEKLGKPLNFENIKNELKSRGVIYEPRTGFLQYLEDKKLDRIKPIKYKYKRKTVKTPSGNKVKVKFKRAIGKFLDYDLKTHGPFFEGDEAIIDEQTAKFLEKRNDIEIIKKENRINHKIKEKKEIHPVTKYKTHTTVKAHTRHYKVKTSHVRKHSRILSKKIGFKRKSRFKKK